MTTQKTNNPISQLNIRVWINTEENFETVRRFVTPTERELNEIKSSLSWGITEGMVMIASERTTTLRWEKR